MRNKISSIATFFVLALLALFSFGLAEEATSSLENQKKSETNEAKNAIDRLNNNASLSESNQLALVNIQGIWKFDLDGKDITIALNQSGKIIFGRAKYEADNPWNGVVAGSLSGNMLSISLAAVESGVPSSIYMGGIVQDDLINGSYIWYDSQNFNSGKLTAIKISPDISIYTPAMIEVISEPEPEQLKQEQKDVAEEEPLEPAEPVVQETKSRFRDVTDLAKGINPNIMPRMAPI